MALSNAFKYKAEFDNPAVLGVLEGPCADIQDSTRNGRTYSEELWERVFEDDIVKEQLEAGGIFGEASHPIDREETDPEKIAIAMKEAPIKKGGKLIGRFYILDTPCGRILKVLADFGYKIGISSRGSGDIVERFDGTEDVDPETYHFECFDAVLLPAVKAARMKLVTEGLYKTKSLKQVLTESLDNANANDRKIMSEALEELQIDLGSSENSGEDAVVTEDETVDDGSEAVKELQQALKDNAQLEKKVAELQEKLSVSYAKEIKTEATVTKLKSAVGQLSESAQKGLAYKKQIDSLQEQLDSLNSTLEHKEKIIEGLSMKFSKVQENSKTLADALTTKDKNILKLTEALTSSKQEADAHLNETNDLIKSLREELAQLKTDSEIQHKRYEKNLKKANQLAESYRKQAQEIKESYIEAKARQLGLSADDFHHRLNENYSLEDVNTVCDELTSYRRNMNKLPISLQESQNIHLMMKENKQAKKLLNPDDEIDKSLFELLE